jgi:tRNA-uridine 2-sulfurtransferase
MHYYQLIKQLIVGRNKMENEILDSLKLDNDLIIEVSNHVGPTCILRTKKQLSSEKEIEIAASTALRYSDSPMDKSSSVRIKSRQYEKEIQVFPIDNTILDELRI